MSVTLISPQSVPALSEPKFRGGLNSSSFNEYSLGAFDFDQLTPPLTPTSPKHAFSHECQAAPDQELCDLSSPTVAVIGVGYVGFHLVERFGSNYPTIAFDISETRLNQIRGELSTLSNVHLTTQKSALSCATHFLVSVPTTLHADNTINTSYLTAALQTVQEYAKPGAVVVIESSVAVGMTRSLLEDLVAEKHIFGGMSPERVDPGRAFPALSAVPKVISGLNNESLEKIKALYTPCFEQLVPVSSCEVAEMVKLYENCQVSSTTLSQFSFLS